MYFWRNIRQIWRYWRNFCSWIFKNISKYFVINAIMRLLKDQLSIANPKCTQCMDTDWRRRLTTRIQPQFWEKSRFLMHLSNRESAIRLSSRLWIANTKTWNLKKSRFWYNYTYFPSKKYRLEQLERIAVCCPRFESKMYHFRITWNAAWNWALIKIWSRGFFGASVN